MTQPTVDANEEKKRATSKVDKNITEVLKVSIRFRLIRGLTARKLLNWVPDKLFLKLLYKEKMGKKLNLENPKTFNEKLQWLKLYDRNPVYTQMVDKFEAKNYVATKFGEQYIIPTLGVWEKFAN